jgi:hypothetical protein
VSIFEAFVQRCADFPSWLLARADEFTLEALQVTSVRLAADAFFIVRAHHIATGAT